MGLFYTGIEHNDPHRHVQNETSPVLGLRTIVKDPGSKLVSCSVLRELSLFPFLAVTLRVLLDGAKQRTQTKNHHDFQCSLNLSVRG